MPITLKNHKAKDQTVFLLKLSDLQMSYIEEKLPFGYSLVLDNKKKTLKDVPEPAKNKGTKKQKANSPIHSESQSSFKNVKSKKPKPQKSISKNKQSNHQKIELPQQSLKNTKTGLVENLREASKILNLLKIHKSAWPFLKPVDAIDLGIPEYYTIIKKPMDLQTIEKKIKAQTYKNFSQFDQDVKKIIENSYLFNSTNEEYLKYTSEFENYYKKITGTCKQKKTEVEVKVEKVKPISKAEKVEKSEKSKKNKKEIKSENPEPKVPKASKTEKVQKVQQVQKVPIVPKVSKIEKVKMKCVKNSQPKQTPKSKKQSKEVKSFQEMIYQSTDQNQMPSIQNSLKICKNKIFKPFLNKVFGPITIKEKKALALQIQKLGKDHIKKIKEIVFEDSFHNEKNFDLQLLSDQKVRELQNYVNNTLSKQKKPYSCTLTELRSSKESICASEESSFQTDSSYDL